MIDNIKLRKNYTVAQYMQLVMNDGHSGYYDTVADIGRQGDFVTAPTLTNLFGQTLAQYLIKVWHNLGQPSAVDLIELGPGEGLLLADIVNHLRTVPGFYSALRIKCVEVNPHFKKRVQEKFTDIDIDFYDDDTVLQTSYPVFIIANEFLDALPVHQFIYTNKGWYERTITVNKSELVFDVHDKHSLQQFLDRHQLAGYYANEQDSRELGAIIEVCPQAFHWLDKMSQPIVNHGGVAVLIDYGTTHEGYGDTLQAVYQHQKIPLMNSPRYRCDLSAHVDFHRLHRSIQPQALIKTLTTQREFLLSNGIMQRALSLKTQLTHDELRPLDQTLYRLLSPEQMGHLFKVLTLTR